MIITRTTAASYAVFFDAIAAQGRALLRVSLDTADTSLAPPQAFLAHAQGLRAILALHTAEADDDAAAGPGGSSSGSGENEGATIERALDALVDPAVQMCVHAAEEKDAARRRNLPATVAATGWDHPVFVLNCLTYLADTLAPHACAARKRAALHEQVEARVRELINEHVRPPCPPLPILAAHVQRHCRPCHSTRTSCVIRACTMPSAHANTPHQTYVPRPLL